ncbi:MAG: SH3 domain-containing protein [Anaerolineae bacterium]|nr:SH3 domain-containing protein [Anaerolineae bacterium]
MRRVKLWQSVLAAGLLISLIGLAAQIAPVAEAAPRLQFSPTPAPVILPSISPTAAVLVTVTPTRTPTPAGPALAEALEGPTNVRAAPDITAERLGQILPGDTYPVLGRGAGTLWYRIQYPDSPNGTAWVYEEVVSITGNIEAIPEIEVFTEPTIDVGRAGATQTIEALAETPGALETATAGALVAGVVVTGDASLPTNTPEPLPTFTYPPGPVAQSTTFIPTNARAAGSEGGLPPIIPIIGLAGLGSLGLLIAVLRRLG